MPTNLAEVLQRQKDILYSSRTRYTGDMAAAAARTDKAPHTDNVHLIYRRASYELESKDYEFSRASVLEHWRAGQLDLRDTIAHPEWLKSRGLDDGVTQYDLTRHSRQVEPLQA